MGLFLLPCILFRYQNIDQPQPPLIQNNRHYNKTDKQKASKNIVFFFPVAIYKKPRVAYYSY